MALAACASPATELEITAGADDWLIVAVFDESLIVRDVRYGPANRSLLIDVDPDDATVTWVLKAGSFVDPRGATIALGTLSVDLSADLHPEACGRCLFATTAAPQPLFDGDQCTPPSWLDHRIARSGELPPGTIDGLAQQIVITGSGACACRVPDKTSERNAVDFRVVGADRDRHPITVVTQALDGSLAFLGTDLLRVVHADGTRTERQFPEVLCGGPDETTRPVDRVVEAATWLGDELIVASRPGRSPVESSHITRLDARLGRVAEVSTTELSGFRARGARPVDGFDGVILFGSVETGFIDKVAALVQCTAPPGGLGCRVLTALETEHQNQALIDVARPRAAGLVGASARARFYTFTPAAQHWNMTYTDVPTTISPATVAPAGTATITFDPTADPVLNVGALEGRLFACMKGVELDGSRNESVITAPFDASPGEWSVLMNLAGGCGGFAPDPTDPDRLWFYELPNRIHVLTTDGQVQEVLTDIAARWRIGGVAQRVQAGLPGRVLFERPDGAWFELVGGGDVHRRYGPALVADEEITATVADGGGFWAFGERGARFRVDGETVRRDGLPGFDGTDIPTAAVRRGGETILTGRGWGDGRPVGWVRAIDDDGSVRELLGPAQLGLRWPIDAAASDDRVVLITDPDGILVLDMDGTLTEVEIEWDDPFTSVVEQRPTIIGNGSTCGPRNFSKTTTDEHGYFAAVDAWGPVAYVSGCFGLFFRVSLIPGLERAERIAMTRLPAESELADSLYRNSPYAAVKTICPDAALAGTFILSAREGHSSVMAIGPAQPVGAGSTVPLGPDPDAVNIATPRSMSSARSEELIGAPPAYTLIGLFEKQKTALAHRFSAGRLRRIPIDPRSAAQNDNGDVLIGSEHGRLAIGKQCDYSDAD